MVVRVSGVKPSNCFRSHPTSMISEQSCGSWQPAGAPRKISFTFRFWRKSLGPNSWWCETCRVIQQQFWMKECDILRWSKHTLTPPTYFQGIKTMIHAPVYDSTSLSRMSTQSMWMYTISLSHKTANHICFVVWPTRIKYMIDENLLFVVVISTTTYDLRHDERLISKLEITWVCKLPLCLRYFWFLFTDFRQTMHCILLPCRDVTRLGLGGKPPPQKKRTSQPPQTGTVIGLFCTAVLRHMLL